MTESEVKVMGGRRCVQALVVVAVLTASAGLGMALLPEFKGVRAAPAVRPAAQGIQASGYITLGGGTCFPDALMTDCDGQITWQLRGPGGAGFFTPYLGRWADLTGSEQTCPAGDKYLNVVTIQVAPSTCGTPTATPVGPSPTPGAATATATTTPASTPTATPVTAGNLAAGRQIFASTSQPGMGPELAIDGDQATFWASHAGFDPNLPAQNVQWIYVDLGSAYQVTKMHMTWGTWRHARTYGIYAWQDWCHGWCIYASTRYGDGDDTAVFPEPVEAQHFMLWLQNPALMRGHYELREWEIEGGVTPSAGPNLAAGKPAVALNSETGFGAPLASDADLATEWHSLSLPVWIYVDLVDTHDVDRATIRWSAGLHATSYAIYTWNGWAWAPVYSTVSGAGGDETAVFPGVRTRWMLLYATSGPAGRVGLRELEFYGPPGASGRPLAADAEWAYGSGAPLESMPGPAGAPNDAAVPEHGVPQPRQR